MKVGQNIVTERANWSFGGNVPDTFVDHVRQSVPYYEDGHDLVCYLSEFFCLSDSVCYELGVSTGELLRKFGASQRLGSPPVTHITHAESRDTPPSFAPSLNPSGVSLWVRPAPMGSTTSYVSPAAPPDCWPPPAANRRSTGRRGTRAWHAPFS